MEIFYRKLRYFFILFFMLTPVGWAQAKSDANTNINTNAAGQVIVVSGPFQSSNPDKQNRTLARGDYFYSGDTLVTGTNATAQIRFSDGTVMALNPNSQIKVDAYAYTKNTQSDKSTVSLVKGGFRALTGLISKENPGAYKVQTPVAVIGVRGTNYSALLADGQLFAGVWKGRIIVSNSKGSIELGEGEDYSFALVHSKDTLPAGLLNPPVQLVHLCGVNYAPHTNI
jgi:hypothetical protein